MNYLSNNQITADNQNQFLGYSPAYTAAHADPSASGLPIDFDTLKKLYLSIHSLGHWTDALPDQPQNTPHSNTPPIDTPMTLNDIWRFMSATSRQPQNVDQAVHIGSGSFGGGHDG